MELEVLRQFYSDVQHAITNPIGVASLLHQEGVVGEELLDEVSPTNKVPCQEKTASIMRHVNATVKIDPKNFWVFLSVLDQFTPCRYLAKRMRQAVDLHASAAQNVSSPWQATASHDVNHFQYVAAQNVSSPWPAASHDALKETVTVSEVYKNDFDAIGMKFVALHLKASRIMSRNNAVTVQELKELLTSYPELESSLQDVETISKVMVIVQRHSSFINCSYLEHIAEHFKLPEVTKEIDSYSKLVDEFCNSKIIQHSYMKRFTTDPPQYTVSSQIVKIKIVLQWNPAAKTLKDIRSLLEKAFQSLSPLIHVDKISEGSVKVVCYAPHYLMGALVKMTKKNKSVLLENGVSYLSIGYTVILDSTDAVIDSSAVQEVDHLQESAEKQQAEAHVQKPLLRDMMKEAPLVIEHSYHDMRTVSVQGMPATSNSPRWYDMPPSMPAGYPTQPPAQGYFGPF